MAGARWWTGVGVIEEATARDHSHDCSFVSFHSYALAPVSSGTVSPLLPCTGVGRASQFGYERSHEMALGTPALLYPRDLRSYKR